ncbi:hypothetical protein [Thalassotalea profundi]|uniref:Pyrrolidone-carboxylate peptidase n=1 Tax=Thalassotalea profundi TaxID=2036687 RepID=A0ABQ3IGI2_9GAMM|nr:hypothetical protein [Thalassotalea profundi]GHE83696.1 hypothetical protein GCM10011501_10380 [Thalassotalea profundi]
MPITLQLTQKVNFGLLSTILAKKTNQFYKEVLLIQILLLLCLLLISPFSNARDLTQITVEELRISKAQKAMPEVFDKLNNRYQQFKQQITSARNYTALTQLIIRHGHGLWQDAVVDFSQQAQMDDRSLYWTRLQMLSALRKSQLFGDLLPMQQQSLVWKFELMSRGQQDIKFDKGAAKKILITGFDPFFLDKNIDQSNPSGITALAFDDLTISLDGVTAEVESVIFPVRFADFDQGIVETLLQPYMKKVDMIVTISMGRENFDLERYPARRRSANAPDNLNIYTGATASNPLIPLYKGLPIEGAEFVEFSLPVNAMKKAQGPFKVNDNRKVSTLSGNVNLAQSLDELKSETSVTGSGGGYLSNEVSYRSILLRDSYNPLLPVGHIHTPRIKAFAPEVSEKITLQIKQMLTLAIAEI